MARFLRLAFLIAFFAQIFVVNSYNYVEHELQRIDEKLDKQANEMKEILKLLVDHLKEQQLTFEKRFKDQEDGMIEQKLNEILAKLTTLETEKQQRIENLLSSQLEQAQKFNKNSTEKIQECKQIAEHQSFKIEEFASNFSSQAIENEIKIQKNESLEQEVPSRNNIVAELQQSQQNSSRLAEKIQEPEIRNKNLQEINPSRDSCEAIMTNSYLDKEIGNLSLPDSGLPPFRVNCQRINGEIWTMIQRRKGFSVKFYRNWTDYKNGFGDLDGEFWLGLEKLHQLTKDHEWELKIWLMDEAGDEGFARYKKFKVGSETEAYKLNLGEFVGNVDFMAYLNGMQFSTPDRDNDYWPDGSCADLFKGGWWFNDCVPTDRNGKYYGNGDSRNLQYVDMSIRLLK